MRIGYVVSEYPAPSHTFIRREIEAIRARGITVITFSIRKPTAATLSNPRDLESFQETSYVLPAAPARLALVHLAAFIRHPIKYLDVLRSAVGHRAPGFRSFLWSLFYFIESIMLADDIKKARVDRVHNHFGNAGANVGLLASRFLDLPWSLTLHGISEFDYPAGLLLSEKIESASFVACASYFVRAQAMRLVSPTHWHKLVIVRCGLDLTRIPQRKIGSSTRLSLVAVGRLSPEKGYAGLLSAFAELRNRGINAGLTIVGDGPDRSYLEKTIADLNLKSEVTLVGQLPEHETLVTMAGGDVLVLPSFMEGLPVVLMEAMALGLPVIASRVAGIPELVTDNESGLLFCPTDWSELTGKIELISKDEELRRRLGTAARMTIERSFAIQHAVAPLIEQFSARHIPRPTA